MPKRKKDPLAGLVVDGKAAPGTPVIKLNLRLFHGSDIAMGPGKADLLEAIVKTGSITSAGKTMEMSYRRAWLLVDEMNRCFKTPLVETSKGGSHGGGARLTPLGHEVLGRYRAMASASKQVAQAYVGVFKDLMAAPVKSAGEAEPRTANEPVPLAS
jgi:molybdate transport system regulatory protein